MSQVKIFRVTGEINKQKFFVPMRFSQEIRAEKMEHAVERVYTDMGSRHRAKRNQITIFSVEEVAEQAG
jgi:large subunit ribosomal protein LX